MYKLIGTVIGAVVAYLLGAFVLADVNPFNWSQDGRFTVVCLGGIPVIFGALIGSDYDR